MGSNATSLAVLDDQCRVVTFVRLDVPQGWSPPEGCTAVPDDELPAGWRRAPGPVPESVTARQIRVWLIHRGISLAAVDEAIGAISDDVTRETVRVSWEYAPDIPRDNPWLGHLAAALGLDEAAVDQAFREAATL